MAKTAKDQHCPVCGGGPWTQRYISTLHKSKCSGKPADGPAAPPTTKESPAVEPGTPWEGLYAQVNGASNAPEFIQALENARTAPRLSNQDRAKMIRAAFWNYERDNHDDKPPFLVIDVVEAFGHQDVRMDRYRKQIEDAGLAAEKAQEEADRVKEQAARDAKRLQGELAGTTGA